MATKSLTGRRIAAILWPSFLMAGVLEALVFVMVDPASLHGLDGEPIGWPSQAVYTAAFFVFWAVIAMAGAMTRLLDGAADDINREGFSGAFRH